MVPAIIDALYLQINEELKLESWKMKAIKDSDELLNASAGGIDDILPSDTNASKVIRENIRLDAQRNEVSCDEIINGYKYGGQYIPVSGKPNNTNIINRTS